MRRPSLDLRASPEGRAGLLDVSRITMPAVIKAMEDNRERIRFANYIGQMYQIICKHAVRIGWLQASPIVGLELLPVPKDRQQPHIPWPDWAVEKWRAEARPMPLLAMELGIGTAQRPGDLPRLLWSAYDGSNLTIVQGKTGAEVTIPCTPQLKAALDAAPRRAVTILTDRRGRPFRGQGFEDMMRAERGRLETLAYDLHAMRYRGVMELAWAGCDDDEIASYSGHASKAMIAKYAGKARQIMRARQAAEKRGRNTNGTGIAKLDKARPNRQG